MCKHGRAKLVPLPDGRKTVCQWHCQWCGRYLGLTKSETARVADALAGRRDG